MSIVERILTFAAREIPFIAGKIAIVCRKIPVVERFLLKVERILPAVERQTASFGKKVVTAESRTALFCPLKNQKSNDRKADFNNNRPNFLTFNSRILHFVEALVVTFYLTYKISDIK